jgi:hypothetical protein
MKSFQSPAPPSQPKSLQTAVEKGPAQPRHHRSFSPVLLWLVCFIAVALAFEGASRLFYYLHWGGHLYGLQYNEYSLRLGWKLAPGSYRYFEVNNQGFRRPNDVSLVAQKDTMRIFLVGGSTAFGSNGLYPQVDVRPLYYEDTIDYQLQELLESRHHGLHFEVINAAVSEYRLFQEMTLFREKLVNYQPQLVIFLDGHNDISFLTEGSAHSNEPAPHWKNRHFVRGERALNESGILGPLYYLDIYLGRASYLYYGLTVLHQRFHEAIAGYVPTVKGIWGESAFHPSDEKALKEKYEVKLRELDDALPTYLELIHDLKASAVARNIKVVYALQPQIVVEEPSKLSNKDRQIQNIAFQHQRDLGTTSWRYVTPKIAAELAKLNDRSFHFVNLVNIAENDSRELYTDYCHLTAQGNHTVAERLYPIIVSMLRLQTT